MNLDGWPFFSAINLSFICLMIYLVKTNKEFIEKKFITLFQSLLKGFLLFSLLGFVLAFIFVELVSNKPHHPHSMIHLLYFFLPLIGAGMGVTIAMLYFLMGVRNINRKLIYSMPAFPFLLVLIGFIAS